MTKFKFDYDKENDSLFLYHPRFKSTGSIEIGDELIIDVDNKKRIVGIEILNASQFLKLLVDKSIESILENLIQAEVNLLKRKGLIVIKIQLKGLKQEVCAPIIPLMASNLEPVLAVA